jgi:hypothetical protein
LRLRFGESQAIAIDGEADASGEVHVRGAIPVLSAATTPAERVERALFLLAMAHPLRRVRRLRLTREVLEADFGEGLGLFWAIAREGAITLGV